MSSSNDWRAGHQPHQDTKEMGAGHVSVHHIKALFSNPISYSLQFQRSATKVRLSDFNRPSNTLLQPTTGATKNRHFMPEPIQLF